MEDARRELLSLSNYVTQRTRRRVEGLTDQEYRWEPVPLCWSLRPHSAGRLRADGAVWPPTTSFTTLAWRLWHLTCCYGQSRNARLLARPVDLNACFEMHADAPQTAAAALAALDEAAGRWRGLLESMSEDELDEPMGPVAGEYAEQRKAGFVLHMIDEFVHHGAEVDLLRDLYRSRAVVAEADPLVVALLEGEQERVDALLATAPDRLDTVRADRPDLAVTAIRNGYWRAVPLLVDLGFPVPDEPDDSFGATPLHWAAGSGNVAVVELLVALGADCAKRDARFNTDARGWAEFYGHQEIVNYLDGCA